MGTRKSLSGLLLVLFLCGACGEKGVERAAVREERTLPAQETKVRKWVEYRGGRKSWEFRGGDVRFFEEPERVESDGVVVDFYDGEEKYLSTLTATSGTIDRKTSDMEVKGNVVLENREGTRLETDWMRWDNEDELVYTDAFVTLIREKRRITGYGLRADPGLKNAEILRDVVAFTVEGPGGR
jgi:LPS export ABC transporter protein LptC